jgi:putative oxidoreductase
MLSRYFSRFEPYAPTILRVVTGVLFILHGLPKFQDMASFVGFFESLRIPAPGIMAPFIAILEVVGGLLLVLGIASRWISLLFVIEMIVSTLLVKLPGVGIIAPPGAQTAGAEVDLMLLAMSLAVLILGPGVPSVERNVLRREI